MLAVYSYLIGNSFGLPAVRLRFVRCFLGKDVEMLDTFTQISFQLTEQYIVFIFLIVAATKHSCMNGASDLQDTCSMSCNLLHINRVSHTCGVVPQLIYICHNCIQL